MPLNEMSLSELMALNADLTAVQEAMAALECHGLVALADLSPGTPMMITLVREMPEVRRALPDGGEGPAPGSIEVTFNGAPVYDGNQPSSPEPWVPEGFPITAEAPPAPATGAECVPAPEPAVTGPGGADRPAAPGPQPKWPVWTDGETARLVATMAEGLEAGHSMWQAAQRAAEVLDRPVQGTYAKARSLVERIEAQRRELADQRLPAPEPQPVSAPAAEAVAEPAPAAFACEDAPVTGGALTPFGQMVEYLRQLPRKRGWSVQRDHDLLHFAELGWKPSEIALELNIPGDEIKPRFAMLTRQGMYRRAEVLEALQDMLSPPAGAEAAAQTEAAA